MAFQNIVLSMDNFLYCFLWAVTALLLNVVVTPVFAVATLPGLVGFFFVQRFYIASSRCGSERRALWDTRRLGGPAV